MVDEKEIIDNIFLINAPAGSGKTTQIKQMLLELTTQNPKDNILCITYTKRAAEELSKNIDVPGIFIGTIHSYIHSLISPFFSTNKVLDLYWEIYGDQIRERIKNPQGSSNIADSNQRYTEKHGSIDENTIRANITSLSYNETSFNSLYYGGLGHDDLISFAKILIERYPAIQNKIAKKFAYIFIDEYQDTAGDILKLFYNVVKNTSIKMYLLGDRMQQIYKNYDGSFEMELKTLHEFSPLRTNYRSVKSVVDILNNIYNDPAYDQRVAPKNEGTLPDYPPQIIITSNVTEEIERQKNSKKDLLVLYLLNKDKFSEIGSQNLYNAYSKMSKYSYVKKYHAVDILSDLSPENPDPLMRFLFMLDMLMEFYKNKNFGRIVAYAKREKEFFVLETHRITKHEDKQSLLKLYSEMAGMYNTDKVQIGDFLGYLSEKSIIREDFYEGICKDSEYENVLKVPLVELMNLSRYLNNPQISTQHGVKGESHTSVLFVAADSKNTPIVHMYEFLRIWSQIDFSLKEFEEFYYAYLESIVEIEQKLGMHISDLSAVTYSKNEENRKLLQDAATEIQSKFAGNMIYELLCKPAYTTYQHNPTLTNLRGCFKESTVYGCLIAYKLFYVGCSRARKNLTIILDANKVLAFKKDLSEKLVRIGFSVSEAK